MKKSPLQISVVVNTKGERKTKLIACLKSIQKNTHHPLEIIVPQQTDTPVNLPSSIFSFQVAQHGTGYAKNQSIVRAKGDVIAFTDDDCVVSKNWIKIINKAFQKYPGAAAVFGSVLPYELTKHDGYTCPSLVTARKRKIFTFPAFHDMVGSGNNMAIRKSTLLDMGGFKDWLGPGSVGGNADDAEIILHLLTCGYKVIYVPESIVFHNRWLDRYALQKQFRSYLYGEMACYTHYAAYGYGFAWKRLVNRIRMLVWRFTHVVKLILSREKVLDWLKYCIDETVDILKGVMVGSYFTVKELFYKALNVYENRN